MTHREDKGNKPQKGKHRKPRQPKPPKCKRCKGKGVIPDQEHDHIDCPECEGTGIATT